MTFTSTTRLLTKTTVNKAVAASLLVLLLSLGLAAPLIGQDEEEESPKIGLVLSGGGAKGFSHVGIIRVLEENNIPIHYIGGTSMGSVIAALYSLGYSVDYIEDLVEDTNWNEKFDESANRSLMNMESKLRESRYAVSLPIRNRTEFGLPSGFVQGQKVSAMLNRLLWPALATRDFNNLPIPFVAVSANIETGEAVPMTEGYLPDVIRASMAVPTLLTPSLVDDKLLVDGGAVRNLPAEDVLALGAQYLICADVSDDLATREDLNSAIDVMVQAASFQMFVSNDIQREYCDVVIRPDVSGIGILDFSNASNVIAYGANAADSAISKIELDIDRLLVDRNFQRPSLPTTVDSVFIVESKIEGLDEIPISVVRSQIQLQTPQWSSKDALETAVDRIYSTGFFKLVKYDLEELDGGFVVTIKVDEKKEDQLRLGMRFDDREKASLLLNTTYKNVGIKGSKWLLDLRLGERAFFSSEYLIGLGIKNRFGLQFTSSIDDKSRNLFQDSERTSQWNLRRWTQELALSTLYSKSVLIGTGIRHNFSTIKPVVAPLDQVAFDNNLLFGFIRFWYDTFDRSYYPTNGTIFRYESEVSSSSLFSDVSMSQHSFSFKAAREFNPNWVSETSFELILSSENTPINHLPTLGGTNYTLYEMGQFIGLSKDELSERNVKSIWSTVRYEFDQNRFITVGLQWGNAVEEQLLDITSENFEKSFFTSLGILTRFGPVKLTFSSSSENSQKMDFGFGFNF